MFDDNNSKPDGKETEVVEKFGDESPDHFVEKLPTNILDRNRSQLIKDQKADVTLRNLSISNSPPKDNDGYYYKDGVLLHRKYTRYPRDGISYVDRVVAPEAYRPEILRVGHSLPMAGHMGQEKPIKGYLGISFGHIYIGKFCVSLQGIPLLNFCMVGLCGVPFH